MGTFLSTVHGSSGWIASWVREDLAADCSLGGALKRTLLASSSSGSSTIKPGIIGSDIAPGVETVSDAVSPASLVVALVVALSFFFRRLTTRVFFFRPVLGCLPAPRANPVVAEFKLMRDGLEGK